CEVPHAAGRHPEGMKRGRAGARIPLALGGGVPRLSRHCCLARAAKFSPGRRHAPEVVTTSTQGRLFSPWPPLVAPRAPRPRQHRPPPARGRGALLSLPRIYFQGSVANLMLGRFVEGRDEGPALRRLAFLDRVLLDVLDRAADVVLGVQEHLPEIL